MILLLFLLDRSVIFLTKLIIIRFEKTKKAAHYKFWLRLLEKVGVPMNTIWDVCMPNAIWWCFFAQILVRRHTHIDETTNHSIMIFACATNKMPDFRYQATKISIIIPPLNSTLIRLNKFQYYSLFSVYKRSNIQWNPSEWERNNLLRRFHNKRIQNNLPKKKTSSPIFK